MDLLFYVVQCKLFFPINTLTLKEKINNYYEKDINAVYTVAGSEYCFCTA